MRLLLDTHTLIWWLAGYEMLPMRVRGAITESAVPVLVSAVSAKEVTTKHRLGKLPIAEDLARDFAGLVAAQGFAELPLSVRHAAHAGGLAQAHKDPFDRMLAAQALLECATLVSRDAAFDAFGVDRLW